MIRLGNRRRRRWPISARWRTVLPRLGFRRDEHRSGRYRDAFVLRGVGNRLGPVLMVARSPERGAAEDGDSGHG